MVLSISERAAAAVEGVDEGILTKIKSSWENTLNQVLRDFNFKQEIYFEYNPLIWHVSKYPIGIRIYRSIAGTITVIEFSTPNKEIPFDIFSNSKSKKAVLAHEIAHMLDDKKWHAMDYKKIAYEAQHYITREQRAELLAFFYEPLGIIHSNKSLIKVASYISETKLENQQILAYAILELLGRIGMNRTINVPLFFKKMSEDQGNDFSRLLRSHITYPYSLAGLLASPEDEPTGIVKASDLIICREKLIDYLKSQLSLQELGKEFKKRGYATKTDKKKLTEAMKKVLIPRILSASHTKRMKDAKGYIQKLRLVRLKNDMVEAIKLCEKFL